jgi:hypothetical protein
MGKLPLKMAKMGFLGVFSGGSENGLFKVFRAFLVLFRLFWAFLAFF